MVKIAPITIPKLKLQNNLIAIRPPWKDSLSENENERLPASKNDMGTQRIPNMITAVRNPDNILFSLFVGFLNSLIPQYIVIGSEIIPAQVIIVPKGIVSLSLIAIVSKEDPVARSIIVPIVTISAKLK